MASGPRRRRHGERPALRALGGLLACLEGEVVTVELKNDLELTGVLDAVDARDLSVVLGKARQRWLEGPRRGQVGDEVEVVMVLGSRIRYVHLPDKLDVDAELRAWHARKTKAAFKRNYIVDRKTKDDALAAAPTGASEALPTLGDD